MYHNIILLAVLAQLVPYIYTSLAEVLLMIKQSDHFDIRKCWRATLLAIVAFAYAFWIIFGAGEKIIAYGMLLFLTGIPFYIWLQAKRTKLDQVQPQSLL
jgi:APA family basic amino acid/polyamine antiporter